MKVTSQKMSVFNRLKIKSNRTAVFDRFDPQSKSLKPLIHERLGNKKREQQVFREESLAPIKKNSSRKQASNFFIHYKNLFNVRIKTIFKEQGQESIIFCHHITISDLKKKKMQMMLPQNLNKE